MGSAAGEGVPREELLTAQTRVWNYTFGCIKPMSLMVAVQLGIPDAVHAHGSPISVPDLASAVGVPEAKVPALRRLMRALSCFGFFDRDAEAGGEETYLPTVFSRQLLKDGPTTAAPFFLHGVYPQLVTPWYSMASWFRGDGPTATPPTSYEAAHGEAVWKTLGKVPEFNDVINGAMASDARWAVGVVAREHPEVFRGLSSLVDIGGGNGAAAKAVKDAFPELKCTVLDLPHVVAASPAIEGVDFVAGDMFEHVPPANAILLKWVLHDWNDEECVRILRRCREAIPAGELGGKVIVLELVMVGDGGGDHELVETQHLFDLQMMAVTGGTERNEGEWRQIFAAAGFSDVKITPVLGLRSIMEAYPGSSIDLDPSLLGLMDA